MKNRLLAVLLALALLFAATCGLAEDAADSALEEAVRETPAFEISDVPPEAEKSAPEGEAPEKEEAPANEEAPAKEEPAAGTEEAPTEEDPADGTAPAENAPETPAEVEVPGDAPTQAEDAPGPEDAPGGEAEAREEASEAAQPMAPQTPEPVENTGSVDPRNCQHPVTVAVVNRDAKDIRYHDLHNGTHRITGTGVLVVLCADCGMVVDRKNEYIEKCSYDAPDETGAVCQYCDHVKGDDGRHIHTFTGEYHEFCGALLEAVPDPDAPELYHICRFQKLRARKCARCDTYEDSAVVPGETIETRENHVWQKDGRCALCGYARTCRHEGGSIENAWNEDETYTFINAAAHEYSAVRYVQRCCAECGEPLGNVEVTRIHQEQPHRFEEGVCADCGYVNVCTHPNMVYTYAVDAGGANYVPVDSLTHRADNLGGIYVTEERCPDCGYALSGVKLAIPASQSVSLPHRFDRNGVCLDCGYDAQVSQETCDHPAEYRVALDPSDVNALKQSCRYAVDAEASTPTEHVLRVEYDPSWTCALCGYHEDLSGSTRVITVSEPHNFYRGYCVTANCGYRCAHPLVNGERTIGAPFYDYDDASGHYETTPTVVSGTCALCGEYVKNHVTDRVRGRKEFHTMEDGVCRKCGYACPHPASEIAQLLPEEHTVYRAYDEAEHEVLEERVTETICQACGYTLFEEVETLGEYRMPHYFVNGVCEQCGYDPLYDTFAPVEDMFDDLPGDEPLHGVCADDGLDIVRACVRVGDSLQAQVDAGDVEVGIKNIEVLFNNRELKRLEALPLRDQLMTAQYFLGFSDAVNRAAASDKELLSRDAKNLIRDIQARYNSMSDDDRAALERARAATFPMTSFEIMPGVTTEVFNIDLSVADDTGASVDRYSFQNTGSSWNLVNVAVR